MQFRNMTWAGIEQKNMRNTKALGKVVAYIQLSCPQPVI